MRNLNYYGMYYSEVVTNQVKSDFLLIKMNKINLEFEPSVHRIIEIVEATGGFFEALKNSKDHIKTAIDSITNTKYPEDPSGPVAYADNTLVNKLLTNGWQNAEFYDEDYDENKFNIIIQKISEDGIPKLSEWERNQYFGKIRSFLNIYQIINLLCSFLNENLIDRLFFNIVMTRIKKTYGKKEIMPGTFRRENVLGNFHKNHINNVKSEPKKYGTSFLLSDWINIKWEKMSMNMKNHLFQDLCLWVLKASLVNTQMA